MGSVVTLDGQLGSGKTCLTQGIARGLGVPKDFYVTSPSYSFMNEYPGRLGLLHVDLYRVKDAAELEDLGVDQMMEADGVTVIEWAEKMVGNLPDQRLSVLI
jgi:tRNA threonylcarbamoyladenosine biosynthesis protein TsaE